MSIINNHEPNGRNPVPVSVVTVTYGDRWQFLQQLLAFVETEPAIERAIVIDNGAHRPILPLLEKAGFSKAAIIRNATNLGSAAGFKLGMEHLLGCEPGWIWLLDDDNLPDAGALQTILRAALELPTAQRNQSAFLAFRTGYQADIAAGVSVRRCYPGHSSFCGFHVADIPFKIWRRRPWRRRNFVATLPTRISIPYAPYSGLFFHQSLLKCVGTPNAQLVLYADDTEFSYRIVKAGGNIWLLPGAGMTELEPSWNARANVRSSFQGWLRCGADFQVFYRARNRAHFDRTCWLQNNAVYAINRFTYLLLLWSYAVRYRAMNRYKLFHHAIVLGERGQLGLSKEFPLP